MKLKQKKDGVFEKVSMSESELISRQPTPYELAMEDWDFPNLSKRVEVTLIWVESDNTALNPAQKTKLREMLQYWDLLELPRKKRNGFSYLYFDSLAANQLAFLSNINVTPEPRPVQPEPMEIIGKKK